MEKIAKEIEKTATQKARTEAYDEGFYMDLFSSGVSSSAEIRREFTDTYQKRRNRGRRGTVNRFIDSPRIKGEDGKEIKLKGDIDGRQYNGSIGYIINEDYKAIWVEFGSMAKGPKFILTKSAEEVARNNNAEFEILYSKTHQQNLSELGNKISQGRTGITHKNKKGKK